MNGHEETAKDDERETSGASCRYGARATSQCGGKTRPEMAGNFLREGRGEKNLSVDVRVPCLGIIASVSTLGCERLGTARLLHCYRSERVATTSGVAL
jgi:hypothetical protein